MDFVKKTFLLVFLLVLIPSLVLGVRLDSGDLSFTTSVSNSTLTFPTYFMDVDSVVVTDSNITLTNAVCFNGVVYDQIFYDAVNSSRDARYYCVDSVPVEPFGSSPSVGGVVGVLPEPDVSDVPPVYDVDEIREWSEVIEDIVDSGLDVILDADSSEDRFLIYFFGFIVLVGMLVGLVVLYKGYRGKDD